MLDDVDLGQRTGLQFQQYGDTIEIAVRANVNASNSRLVTYQIDVFYDTAAFEFVSDSCKAGEPGDFDCAGGAYDGDGRVRMLGTDLYSEATGPDVLIGTFTLSMTQLPHHLLYRFVWHLCQTRSHRNLAPHSQSVGNQKRHRHHALKWQRKPLTTMTSRP